eukprot:363276-Chlamydomonas_euryale.AAC.9
MTPSVLVTSRPLRTPSRLPHSEHGSAHGGIHAPCRASLMRPTLTAGLLHLVGLPSPTKCGRCMLQVRQTGKAACLPTGNRAGAPPDYLVAPLYAFQKGSFLCSQSIKHTASVPSAVTPLPLYSSPSSLSSLHPTEPTSKFGHALDM